jgi:bifunctional DNA-binding transcriptional regulator/antitoxin component of YhaV-PrlF toxin-antitoxin module
VIPANLRKRYGLTEGTTVVFHQDRGRLVLASSNHQAIYALQGTLAGFLSNRIWLRKDERT